VHLLAGTGSSRPESCLVSRVRCDSGKHGEVTEVVPEYRDFGLNDGRKSQSDSRSTGVVGGDPAKSNCISELNSLKAIMMTDFQRKRCGEV
jgi:hypothetical protein